MKKLNFDTMEDIKFPGSEEKRFSIPIVEIYSWGKVLKANELLSQTKEYIRKWYLVKDGLEDVLDGIGTLWETLKATVAESNLQYFLDHGYLEMTKDSLIKSYDTRGQPFADGLQYITDFWYETTLDEAQKQAYREERKENRGRVMGFGFGITGGLKAAIGSGLGNMATGAAHGLFNAVANGIGSIAKTNKLNEFYNKESTLNSLINGWAETFWLIYDEQIFFINDWLVEPKTTKIYSFKKLIASKKSAENRYNNMQKAVKLSDEAYLETILDCIDEFPFEKEYWIEYLSAYYMFPFTSDEAKTDFYDNIVAFLKKFNEYIDDFYSDEFAAGLVEILIDIYIKKAEENEQNAKNIIFSIIKEKIKDDDFELLFVDAIENIITDEDVSIDYIKQLLILINKLDYDIDNFEHDEEFKLGYEKKMNAIAYDYSEENISEILSAMESGNVDPILKDIANDPTLEPDRVLVFIIYTINEKFGLLTNIENNPKLLDSIELLKRELKVERNIAELKSFSQLKIKLTPTGEKIKLFECFVHEINEKNPYFLKDNIYWGNIPISSEIRKNFREYGVKETENIFLAIDGTIFKSGKIGIVFTPNGLYIKMKEIPMFYLSWDDLVDKHEIAAYEAAMFIRNIDYATKERTFIREVKFGNTESSVLVNLIAGAGYVFTGNIIKINDFKPIAGAVFDISELEKKLSGIIKPDSNELKNEENDKTNSKKTDDQESEPKQVVTSQKERENYYNFLKEEDRIFKAVKFKEKKGFFKRVLPSSWIVTILFYGFISIIGMIFISFLAFEVINSEVMENIVFFAGIFALPISLLFFGIRKRVKYIKEKKWWKDCTNNGQKNIKDVFKEFQEMQDKYINNNGKL